MRIMDWSSGVWSSDLEPRIVAVEDVEIIEDRRRLVRPGGRRHQISRSRDGIEPAAFELEFVALGVAADALEVVQDQDLRLGARLFAVIIGRGEAAETAAYDDEVLDLARAFARRRFDARPGKGVDGFDRARDRKSTRLNSSH